MNVTMTHRSDCGRVRTGNEDTVYCAADPAMRRGFLMIVADGMGGQNAGEVASRLAVDTVAELYFASSAPPCEALRDAVLAANRRIYEAAQSPETSGMGTTCSALAILGTQACIAHVGDSRVYRLRQGELTRVTRVHSVWGEQVSKQGISPAIRAGQNVLTRALGVVGDVEADVADGVDVIAGDRFLLCSDGLWGLVTDPEIASTMQTHSLDDACRLLVALANERGGPDNISVVAAEVHA